MNLNYLRRKRNVAHLIYNIYHIVLFVVAFLCSFKIAFMIDNFMIAYLVSISPLIVYLLLTIRVEISNYKRSCDDAVNSAEDKEKDEKLLNSIPYKWEKVELKTAYSAIDFFLRQRHIKQVYIRRCFGDTLEIKVEYIPKLLKQKTIAKKWTISFDEAKNLIKL